MVNVIEFIVGYFILMNKDWINMINNKIKDFCLES